MEGITVRGPISVLGILVAALLLLPGCRQGETERSLWHGAGGAYQGQPDTPLSAPQEEQLRQRLQGQRL